MANLLSQFVGSIIKYIPFRGQWMDPRCRLGNTYPSGGSGWILGVGWVRYVIYPLPRGVAISMGRYARATVRPTRLIFSCPLYLFEHINSSLFTLFLGFFVSFLRSYALVFGKTVVHMSSTFPLAIQNDTLFFCEFAYQKTN